LEARWREDPESVTPEWRAFIEGRPLPDPAAPSPAPSPAQSDDAVMAGLLRLADAYRARGYQVADYDPLGLAPKPDLPDLDPAFHGLSDAALARPLSDGLTSGGVAGLGNGHAPATLGGMVDHLAATYCGTLSADFMHLEDAAERASIAKRLEAEATNSLPAADRRWILEQLVIAEEFENFLHAKYPTIKRFGMEGCEAQLPFVERLLRRAAGAGVEEVVIGPMHRGRTTFMATFMGKSLAAVIAEFSGRRPFPDDIDAAGDTSYHMGHSGTRGVDGHTVRLSMASHPSHVEAIIPVSLGKLRAKRDRMMQNGAGLEAQGRLLGLMMHTDGGCAGQGIVSEALQLARLEGFGTGGSIHFTVDNRVAFTTRPEDSRTSRFASDIFKLIGAPVFRVNGDDPEAAFRAADIAFDYWRTFGRDVAVELVCYRRRGHNELDEPRYTQPRMYREVGARPTVRQHYRDRLVADGTIDEEGAERLAETHLERYEAGYQAAQSWRPNETDAFGGVWQGFSARGDSVQVENPDTGVEAARLKALGRAIHRVPDGFEAHPKIARQLEERQDTIEAGTGMAWSTVEALAFASLLDQGMHVRLTGQDSRRGTFSQRHGVVFDQLTDSTYAPLSAVNPDARFDLYDSPLSEAGVLAFEYGYSMAAPDTLTCWEAQFGDFANGAQIIIDQFIASGAEKWFRHSGLVLLLPHGLEGGGPEHSSARLERFLQLCARDNLQIVNCSTPANYFHALRRQMVRNFRQPLVVMTPKSLLRHRQAVAGLDDLAPGSCFQPFLPHAATTIDEDGARRLILCTGRIYYDLIEARDREGVGDVAIARVEELYPLPETALMKELARFPQAEVVWCQEEPKNMGAWTYMDRHLARMLSELGCQAPGPRYVGRPANPSPSVGYPAVHKASQAALVAEALSTTPVKDPTR
jgi:2-oxoglutarate dehydrogenase E1 component